MTSAGNLRILRTISLLITIFFLSFPANAKYSGGTGEPNDPYQIATAEDLMLLGETPEDYDKHFILIADIDLDPNLPGRKVFDRAIISAYTLTKYDTVVLIPFTGIFDGNGYTISHLIIAGDYSLGVFHMLGMGAEVKDLGVVDVNIVGLGSAIGGLAGSSYGVLTNCYSTGAVTGDQDVGGLVGYISERSSLINCHSSCAVRGSRYIGGLVGKIAYNWYLMSWGGTLTDCYSTGAISGEEYIGGLVGENGGLVMSSFAACHVSADLFVGGLVGSNGGEFRGDCRPGTIRNCYSRSVVVGVDYVGGVAGYSLGDVTQCYSVGTVSGSTTNVGGLVGVAGECECGDYMGPTWILYGVADACFWDMGASDQIESAGGIGLTTAKMQTASTFLDAGWDFVGETENGTEDIWKIAEGVDYPRLAWEKYSGGTGEPNNPYQIATADDLMLLGETPEDYDKHFILTADIDLDPNLPGRKVFDRTVISHFTGTFDGGGHTISHLTIGVGDYWGTLGLFNISGTNAEVRKLGMVDVDITGSEFVGGLVGINNGSVSECFSTGTVSGTYSCIGGLVGINNGSVSRCHSRSSVSGFESVGGLAGHNWGIMSECDSTGVVGGNSYVGGLVGGNGGTVVSSYTACHVIGDSYVGGIVGSNGGEVRECYPGTIRNCYSMSVVIGADYVGGVAGYILGIMTQCYSAGTVTGTSQSVGGLDGSCGECVCGYYMGPTWILYGVAEACFWDMQTSGQDTSDGGTGKTTIEMQTASTFLDAGWDFEGETANGTEDIWWIDEGLDYPRLWWEVIEDNSIP